MPSYGGYTYYRPYNFRNVMPQAQTAAGWGMPVTMPYSQQFWHRYQKKAAMEEKLTQLGAAEIARLRVRQQYEAIYGAPAQPQPIVSPQVIPQQPTYQAGASVPPSSTPFPGIQNSVFQSRVRNLPSSSPRYVPQDARSGSRVEPAKTQSQPSLEQIKQQLQEQLRRVEQLEKASR